MPETIVCYKWVPDEQDVKVQPATLQLDFSKAKYKISEYDRNAIEEALLLKEKHGGAITALTFGPAAARQSLKDVLSRGPDQAAWVNDEAAAGADAFVTAVALAAAVKKCGPFDLILCGEGSSDAYSQQVGPRLAALLGIPALTYVSELTVGDGQVTVTRKLGGCTEVATAPLPALVTVLPEINKPRIPGLKQVLAAAKKPVAEHKAADLGLTAADLTPKTVVKSIRGYVMSRKNVIIKDGTATEKAAALAGHLAKEGAL